MEEPREQPSWASVEPDALSDRDRMLVRDARAEIAAAPLPASRGPVGCLAAVLGGAVLAAWPAVRDVLPIGDFVSPFVVLAGILLVAGGLFSSLLRGRGTRAADAAVEAALRQLEGESRDRDVDLRAATLLISHAYVSDGPSTVRTFDPEDVAPRLGGRLPLVLAVQEALSDEPGVRVPFGPGEG